MIDETPGTISETVTVQTENLITTDAETGDIVSVETIGEPVIIEGTGNPETILPETTPALIGELEEWKATLLQTIADQGAMITTLNQQILEMSSNQIWNQEEKSLLVQEVTELREAQKTLRMKLKEEAEDHTSETVSAQDAPQSEGAQVPNHPPALQEEAVEAIAGKASRIWI